MVRFGKPLAVSIVVIVLVALLASATLFERYLAAYPRDCNASQSVYISALFPTL